MDESGNEIEKFETILKIQGQKKPLSLYGVRDKIISLSSKTLNPQDIISSVSRQLRDIQKADCLKKERSYVTKPKHSEFIPVTALSRKEPVNQHKFETQCVTDTQLIDIVDSVEAMVVNKGIADEFETIFCHKQRILHNNLQENFTNVSQDEQISLKDDNFSKECYETKQIKEDSARENEDNVFVNNYNDIFEINTDIQRDFETSYSKTYDNNNITNNQKFVEDICNDEPENVQSNKETTRNCRDDVTKHKNESKNKYGDVGIQICNTDSYKSKLDIIVHSNEDINVNKCNYNDVLINSSNIANVQETEDHVCNESETESDIIVKIPCLSKEDEKGNFNNEGDFTQIFDEETNSSISLESKECPLSPIFNHHKAKRKLSPLVFPLESFEKFESLAMPLIEENLDFESAKQLINSQIINKELLIQYNATPTLGEPKESITRNDNDLNVCNDELSEDSPRKYETNTVKEKSYIENRPSNSFEDEIIFSSDEENDYLHNVEDLPMTCALKTYSNESEIVDLSKTMFVGFQTSSNKSIQIFKESFDKAQHIFTNIEKVTNEDLTLTELVGINDGNISNNLKDNLVVRNNVDDDRTIGRNLKNIENVLDQTIKEEITIETEGLIGFKTANGKTIDISEKALQNCKRIFKDIEDENFDMDSDVNTMNITAKKREFESLTSGNNKRIKVAKESIQKFENINNAFLNFIKEPSNVNLEANNSPEKVESPVKYEKGDNVLMDSDLYYNNINDHNEELNIVDQTILEEFENDSIEETVKHDKLVNNVSEFVGFKTASKKDINISVTALKKCENIFKDIDSVTYEGFDPGIVKNTENVSHAPLGTFAGFKTANNKDIKISREALEKTIDLFQDIELDNFKGDSDFKSNNMCNKYLESSAAKHTQSKSLKSKNVSIESFSENKWKLNKKSRTEMPLSDQGLSKVAVSKAKTGVSCTEMNSYFSNIGITTEIKHTGKENYNKYEHIDIINEGSSNIFQGFKTASNKTVDVSEKALSKTKNIFQDIEIDANEDVTTIKENVNNNINLIYNNNSTIKPSCFSGFKTANDKPVKVSDAALLKTKSIFQDIDVIKDMNTKDGKICDINNIKCTYNNKSADDLEIKPAFQGFTTANNKVIEVSEKALLNSRKILEADVTSNSKYTVDCKVTPCYVNGFDNFSVLVEGFKTASNRNIHVPEIALLNAKNLFKDIDSNDERKYSNLETQFNFGGFKTAGNKSVKVSKEALLKSKKIFDDIHVNDYEKDILLKTGVKNGNYDKHSNIGEVADVGRSKSLKGLKIGNSKQNISKDTSNFEINVKSFDGFKTASNKQVNISKDALIKTKNIFKDIEFDNDNFNKGNDEKFQVDFGICEAVEEIEDKVECNLDAFIGFQTASNKRVKVSDDVISKSKKLFEDINFGVENKDEYKENKGFDNQDGINNNVTGDNSNKEKVKDFEFRTTNKSINITDDSLKKSKQCLPNMDNNMTYTNVYCSEINKYNETRLNDNLFNADKFLDTQVINNFEETLYTEDFYKDVTPRQCKRSGSPILSCPKAKKRKKFETPYKSGKDIVKNIDNINITNTDKKYKFAENYKKTKLYNLKELNDMNQKNISTDIDPYVLNFEFDTLLNFEFEKHRNDLTAVRWTTDNVKTCFVESVDRKIIPDGWLDNHLKWILWKLISYEIRFATTMKGVCSVRNVLEQLKYRYDKELYNVERPALRKILEKDDVSTRTMVLAVVAVYVDGVRVNSVVNPTSSIELLLTDGWYSIRACVDRMLANLVCKGRIAVGSKLATAGAELLNCEQGVSPWEDTSSVRLKIFGNSTRPARWDAKLGYHSNGTIFSQLRDVDALGGKVSKTRALVVRVYPALYVERFEDGSTGNTLLKQRSQDCGRRQTQCPPLVAPIQICPYNAAASALRCVIHSRVVRRRKSVKLTRSERLENIHLMKYETERERQLEKLYEEVEREFFEQDSSESEGVESDVRKSLQTGSQINKIIKECRDSTEYRCQLTDTQSARLHDYTSRRREKMLEALQKRVQDRIQEQRLHVGRNVVMLLKIRVAGFKDTNDGVVTKAMISIWRPNDAILDVIKEGTWIDIFNVIPTAVRNSEIQISAGRQSVFHRSKRREEEKFKSYVEGLKRKCLTIKELVLNPSMVTDFNEIDTLGAVFLIEPSPKDFEITKSQFQNVYLTDIDKNFICINFWGGIKKYGYENIFATGNIVACCNLQKRAGNTRKNIPQFRATELSVFTETSKFENVRKMADEMSKCFNGLNKRKFCDDCVLIKNNYTTIKQMVSPYRFNNSDHNFTRNKIFIDSPLIQSNLNLTGLDFESSFKQTDADVTPAILRKQRVNEKIATLKMYGEPPPLSKIFIVNKSKNAASAYKSPLTSDVLNVASVRNDSPVTSKLNLQSSPILSVHRPSVRFGANPVRLDFSSTAVTDKVETNPFEEEFEASPPLSLD